MANYLAKCTTFWRGSGTAGLIAEKGAFNLTEVGIVAENAADGPPPELSSSSRGPCNAANGFQGGIGAGGEFDHRGAVSMTVMAWWRHDARTTDQFIVEYWSSTIAQQNFIMRYEHAFTTMVVHAKGLTNNIDAGPGTGLITTNGTWNFGGFSWRQSTNKFYVHCNGVTRHSDLPAFGGWAFTDLTSVLRVGGSTVAGGTGEGIVGDVAYVAGFKNYGFDAVDWSRMWNSGKGRKFPGGWIFKTKGGYEHYYQGAKAS